MEIYQIVILSIFLSLVLAEILFTNFFNKNGQRTKDGVVEFFSFFIFSVGRDQLILQG